MKSTCLVLLAMLSLIGLTPTNAYSASFSNSALTQATAGDKQSVGAPQVVQAPANANTVTEPPVATSKVSKAKANNKAAQPCKRQPATNHDAQVIPPPNASRQARPRIPAEQQTQCQAQKPLHKPPPN